MLKKLSLALCVASVLGGSVAQAAETASGQVTFSGTVTTETPAVFVKYQTATGNGQFGLDNNAATNIISLGEYAVKDLDSGQYPATRARLFEVIVTHPTMTNNPFSTITLTMTSSQQPTANGILPNDLTNAAQNVGVALRYIGAKQTKAETVTTEGEGTPIFTTGSTWTSTDTSFGVGEFDPTFYFKAALQKIDPNNHIVPGSVQAGVTISLQYE